MLNIRFFGTKVKSSNSVEIKPNQSAWEKQDDVKLETKETNINFTPSDSSFHLHYDDLRSSIKWFKKQVVDSLFSFFFGAV